MNNAQTCENGKNDNKKRVCVHNNVTKINSNFLRKRGKLFVALKSKQMLTAEICLWLLVLCTMVVLTLTPIFCSSKHLPLDASGYLNSPWVEANNGEALFTSDGEINGETLYDLLTKINQIEVWQDSETGNNIYKTETHSDNSSISEGQEVYYLSAKNFGKLNDGSASTNNGTANENAKGNAQLQVVLFDGATLGTIDTRNNTGLNIDGASTGCWQAVYRSMDSTNDVLTLYMRNAPCSVYYDANSNYYGYYRDSNLREVAQGTYTALKNVYASLDTYTVLPANIPGLWQSSAYQTGADRVNTSYIGASRKDLSSSGDATNNGLDDLGTPSSDWPDTVTTTTIPYDNDKLWVPSNYEVIYKDNTTDGHLSYIYVSDFGIAGPPLTGGDNGGTDGENDGRSGLWELSGYDRASGSWTWLRSDGFCYYNYNGNNAEYNYDYDDGGVQVALHLDLKQLANDTLAKITASASGANISSVITGITDLQTIKGEFNYNDYVIKNSTNTTNGTRTITFGLVDTSQYDVSSFVLQSENVTKIISLSGTSGSGTATGLCDYSYFYNSEELQVVVSNVSTATLNVNANVTKNAMTLNLQVNNSALNSLLVLTLLNGDDKIGEYGFVYNLSTQAVSITLPTTATIKILATKPFGSRVELLLDGASLAPTGVTSYEIPTGTGSSKTLVVNLVGNSQWSNAIVI